MTGRQSRDRFTANLQDLLRLDRLRVAGFIRDPAAASVLVTLLPAILIFAALWIVGSTSPFAVEGPASGATLGMLISGVLSFLSYGILFSAADDRFLRRSGIDPRALYIERTLRLTLVAGVVSFALALPYLVSGATPGRAILVALAAGAGSTAVAALVMPHAAAATASRSGSALGAGIRQFDPELARAAALVYAPLLPFLAGIGFGGASAASPASALFIVLASILLLALGAVAGARTFARAAPRFQPMAGEMSFVPPAEGAGESFRPRGGVSVLLPGRAALLWVRDATIAGRRFPWAARLSWPVAIASIVGLARWGEAPGTRTWVVIAVGCALLVQAGAVIALGRLERSGTRWIDRAAAVTIFERFLGRWAWAWGLALWLLIPVAAAWTWWSGVDGALRFPLAGALTAAGATALSLRVADRKR